MAGADGRDPAIVIEELARNPARLDFFEAVRRIERNRADLPPVGTSARLREDALRFIQKPDLAFAPTSVSGFDRSTSPPALAVNAFGLLGPGGPLPLHITEYIRQRATQAGDRTASDFLDIFHHRSTALFYRAWARTAPATTRDRAGDDWFTGLLLALGGTAAPAVGRAAPIADADRAAMAGRYLATTRSADGLAAVLSAESRVPVTVDQFVPSRLPLDRADRWRLGRRRGPARRLGQDLLLGRAWYSRTDAIRLRIGPLDTSDYERLQPGGAGFQRLRTWLRSYLPDPLRVEIRYLLEAASVPRARLGFGRLGRHSWLQCRPRTQDADDAHVVVPSHSQAAADRPPPPEPLRPLAQAPETEPPPARPSTRITGKSRRVPTTGSHRFSPHDTTIVVIFDDE